MLLSGPLALLAAAIVGWFMARRALRPVARMTSTAASISINHLDERVPVPGGTDELNALAETLNDMLGRLETGVRDKRRLVANASHELQTPLAVMRTELDVYLATTDLPPDAVEILESVREESDRMSRIVRNLLTLARFDDGNLTLLKEHLDLHELAEEAVASLAEFAKERRVSVTVEGDSALAPADPEYIRLVVANLLENAIKYSGADTEVHIVTSNDDDEAVLEVADTGQGIPASAIPHLFDRFFRVESARAAENSGSGLGLAITKEIVEVHGGRIEIESELNVGTRFTVRLPKFKRNRS
jgi:two-component system OmpR family sensor kinase